MKLLFLIFSIAFSFNLQAAESQQLACLCSEYFITTNNIQEVKRLYGLTRENSPINKSYEACKSFEGKLTFSCNTQFVSKDFADKMSKTSNYADSSKKFKF